MIHGMAGSCPLIHRNVSNIYLLEKEKEKNKVSTLYIKSGSKIVRGYSCNFPLLKAFLSFLFEDCFAA